MRATPDELIEDLRDLARAGVVDLGLDVPLATTCEWEAADFIAAALPVLLALAQRGDDLGLLAQSLLEGDYPAVSPG